MPVIRINDFGGERPSVSPRYLQEKSAQVASNLLASTPEFRPLLGAGTSVSLGAFASDPKTIYKYPQQSGSWYSSMSVVNMVRGQINGDPNELTYMTYQDGSAPPNIYPSGLVLGVPAPLSAPTVTVNTVAQFTESDRSAAIAAAGVSARDAVHNNMAVAVACGSDFTAATGFSRSMGVTVPGYFNRDMSPTAGETSTHIVRAYRATSTGGAFNGGFETAYVTSNNTSDNFAWAADPALQGFWRTMPAGVSIESSAWGATIGGVGGCVTGDDHYCLAFPAYAMTYTLNTSTAKTALKAILLPGSTTEFLYTDAEAQSIVDSVNTYLSVDNAAIRPKFKEMADKVAELKVILDGGVISFTANTMSAYYGTAGVSAEIDAAFDAFANAVADAAITVANSRTAGGYLLETGLGA